MMTAIQQVKREQLLKFVAQYNKDSLKCNTSIHINDMTFFNSHHLQFDEDCLEDGDSAEPLYITHKNGEICSIQVDEIKSMWYRHMITGNIISFQ